MCWNVIVTATVVALATTAEGRRRARPEAGAAAGMTPTPTLKPQTTSHKLQTAAPAEFNPPSPGSCAALQPGLKVCSTISGRGSFDVRTAPPSLVLVSFDEPVTWVNPPPKEIFRADLRENTVTIKPLQKSFPDPTPVVITAGRTVVTLNLRPATRGAKADTQVIVKDPGEHVRDAEIDERVEERLRPRLEALAKREKELEKRAAERSRTVLLDELVRAGVDVEPLDAAARNDAFIVLRAKVALRIGSRHYVLVTVENRSPDPFEVKAAHAWKSEGGSDRPVKAVARLAATRIHPGEEVAGAIEVPLRRVTAKTRIRLRIEESSPSRAVELGGIVVP